MKKLVYIIVLAPTTGAIAMQSVTKKARITPLEERQADTAAILEKQLNATYVEVEKLEEKQDEKTLSKLGTGVKKLIELAHTLETVSPDKYSDLEDSWVEILKSLQLSFSNLTRSKSEYAHGSAFWLIERLNQLADTDKENMTAEQYEAAYEVLSELSGSIIDGLSTLRVSDFAIKTINNALIKTKPTDNE